jgi:hypothetical protein
MVTFPLHMVTLLLTLEFLTSQQWTGFFMCWPYTTRQILKMIIIETDLLILFTR